MAERNIMGAKYRALQPGNQSAADDLFDLGEALAYNKRCDCHGCQTNLKHLIDTYKPSIIDLAERWFLLRNSQAGVVVRGLVDGWTEDQCAKAVGLENFTVEKAA